MLKTAFGDNARGKTQTSEWFCWFKRGETSVEHQEHVDDRFCLWGHRSPEICSSRPNGEPALLPGGFEVSEGASPLKTSGTMEEQGLAAPPWHCTGAHCFVCAAIFGR
jgi:hypothetical protein